MPDADVAGRFAMTLGEVLDADVGAHGNQKVEQRGTGGVQSDALDQDLGIRHDQSGNQEEGRRGEVAGHPKLLRFEMRPALNRDRPALLVDLGPEFPQRDLGVVAGGDRFAHRGAAFGIQAGKEDASLDLCARDGQAVVHGRERAAADCKGRKAVFPGFDARTHLAQEEA